MPINDNILIKPIGWGDISSALGVGGPPYAMGNMVANSTILNKFSRHKPVENSSNPGILTESEFKATNWGFGVSGIPSYSTATVLRNSFLAATAGSAWTYTKPSTWWRSHDLDYYALLAKRDKEWGVLGAANNGRQLNFPFGGTITIRDTTLGPSDIIDAELYPTDPDDSTHSGNAGQGLLYPWDFSGMTAYNASYVDYYNWYFGLALIPESSDYSSNMYIRLVTDTTSLATHGADSNSTISIQLGSNLLNTQKYYIVPILAKAPTSTSTAWLAGNNWTGESSTYIQRAILLDGYALSFTYSSSASGFTVRINNDVTVASGKTTFTITVKNTTSSMVTIYDLFAYIMTEGAFDNVDGAYAAVDSAITAYPTSHTHSDVVLNGKVCAKDVSIVSSATTIAVGATRTFTGTLNATQDAYGYGYGAYSSLFVGFRTNLGYGIV